MTKTPQTPTKTVYYASLVGKLPRKRKEQRFETTMLGDTPIEAITKLNELIKAHNIKNPRNMQFQAYEVSETSFIDSQGNAQVVVFRSMFPCGSAIAV